MNLETPFRIFNSPVSPWPYHEAVDERYPHYGSCHGGTIRIGKVQSEHEHADIGIADLVDRVAFEFGVENIRMLFIDRIHARPVFFFNQVFQPVRIIIGIAAHVRFVQRHGGKTDEAFGPAEFESLARDLHRQRFTVFAIIYFNGPVNGLYRNAIIVAFCRRYPKEYLIGSHTR